jgi:hypothetical protein
MSTRIRCYVKKAAVRRGTGRKCIGLLDAIHAASFFPPMCSAPTSRSETATPPSETKASSEQKMSGRIGRTWRSHGVVARVHQERARSVSDPASIAVAGGVFGVALFTALALSLQWLVQAMRPKKQERAASADPSQPSEPPTIDEPGATTSPRNDNANWTTSSPPGMQRATRSKAKGHSTIVQV